MNVVLPKEELPAFMAALKGAGIYDRFPIEFPAFTSAFLRVVVYG